MEDYFWEIDIYVVFEVIKLFKNFVEYLVGVFLVIFRNSCYLFVGLCYYFQYLGFYLDINRGRLIGIVVNDLKIEFDNN